MVYFVGAGTGAADLITVRGMRLLQKADVIIYAGSLVNPELLDYARESCEIYNSAKMTLDEVIAVMKAAEADGKMTVRLHTGEPSIYGAVREQMDELDTLLIPYESCPGVSACFGAAASLNIEYTLPGISQSLIYHNNRTVFKLVIYRRSYSSHCNTTCPDKNHCLFFTHLCGCPV